MSGIQTKIRVNYVSAPCGAGKTEAAIAFIQNHRQEANFIFVSETNALLWEVKNRIHQSGLDATIISSATHHGQVVSAIQRHVIGVPENSGDILLITWEALTRLPYMPPNKKPHIIIDEIPQADQFFSFHLPVNSHLIRDHISLVATYHNSEIAMVRGKDSKRLQKLLREKDDCIEPLRGLFSCLCSPNMITFVDVKSWNAFHAADGAGDKTLFFLSLLSANLFQDVILLGANIEDSLLFKSLPRFFNCQFVPHEEINSSLSATPPVGGNLKIRFLLEGRLSSKTTFNQQIEGDKSIIDQMDEVAIREFGNDKYLYVPNTDRTSVIDGLPNARRISSCCRGVNSYQDYSKIYFSAALNRSPAHCGMLRNLGFTHDELVRSTAGEAAYQAMMRTSLRNPSSHEPVTAIVGDERVARYLATLTGCKDVEKIGDIKLPIKPSPLTPTQKDQRSTAKKARENLMEGASCQPNASLKENSWESAANDSKGAAKGEQTSTCCVTFHKRVTDHKPEQFRSVNLPLSQFIKALRQQSKAPIDTKEEQYLFNPATFISREGESFRTQASFGSSSAMVLDFDDGNLSPERFKGIFWNDVTGPLRTSFIICNSFSRSPERPNKFRVILPYCKPAQSIAEHQAVYDSIVARLEESGFTRASAKLDLACRSGVQSFYLPCTNRAYPDWAFFETFGTDQKDFARHALNPDFLAKLRPTSQDEGRIARDVLGPPAPDEIVKLISPLLSMTEGRHDEAHKAVFQLKARGLSDNDVLSHLPYRSEPHMQKKVRNSLNSWSRRRVEPPARARVRKSR